MRERRLMILLSLRLVIFTLLVGGILFGAAGTWHYWQAWVFLGVYTASSVAISLYFVATDPAFVERRMRWRERERRQRIGQAAMALVYIISILVPGLDRRCGWSSVPVWLVIASNVAIIIGFAVVFRAFRENRYAASTVVVEAGQRVISSGPYALVRHPIYAGALLMFLFEPLALGSYWGVLTCVALAFCLVLRIRNEEALLRRELPGYPEYCERVRWRLLPRVW